MKFREVKIKFQEDFINNFYDFNGIDVYNKIITNKDFHLPVNQRISLKPRKLTLAIRIASVIFIVFLLFISKHLVNSDKESSVERGFKENNVEITAQILISSSYKGEELRIYKGFDKNSKTKEIEFFYYYNEVRVCGTEYILFKNINTTEQMEVYLVPKFGNISKLISTNPNDIIEVTIYYENGQKLTQYFTC